MAAYIAAVFYATMVASALVMDVAFSALGLVPKRNPDIRIEMTQFSLNYTFWLNVVFGLLALYLLWLSRRHPMDHAHHDHAAHGGDHGSEFQHHEHHYR